MAKALKRSILQMFIGALYLNDVGALKVTQVKREFKDICIDDMCVSAAYPRDQPDHHAHRSHGHIESQSAHHRQMVGSQEKRLPTAPGCKARPPPDTRHVLLPLVAPYHASTALEGGLMSSGQMATLCSYNGWQCEGKELMQDHGYDALHQEDWDFTDMLRIYSEVWGAQKSVLLEKTPMQPKQYSVRAEEVGIRDAPIPDELERVGVAKLDPIYIIMWRPFCLGTLSSHFRTSKSEEWQLIAEELHFLQQQVEAHKYLLENGHPVLVINFADMIWNTDVTQERLEEFLPCLGKVDLDYLPQLGKDIFPGNHWKAAGTVREYGYTVDPSDCCNYDSPTSKCTNPFQNQSRLSEYNFLVDYLLEYS